jgi:hypothetical protein
MVVDAVVFEPVSATQFPVNRENYSEFGQRSRPYQAASSASAATTRFITGDGGREEQGILVLNTVKNGRRSANYADPNG